MDIKPAEISAILKKQIADFGGEAEVAEVGQVLSVGDGIARGPAPFSKSDRSRFLSALDAALVALKKTRS